MAIYGKAGALGLGDFQGLQVLAKLFNELGGVVARVGGKGNDAVIVNAHDFHLVQVHQRAEALDGPGVTVVGGTGAEEVAGQGQAAALFVLVAIVTRGPGVNHHQVGVGDAAFPEGGLEPGVGPDRGFALGKLVEHDAGLHAGDVLPGGHLPLAEGNDSLPGGGVLIVQDDQEGLAVNGVAGGKSGRDGLVGFIQDDGLEAHPRTKLTLLPEDSGGEDYFPGRERIQGVGYLLVHSRDAAVLDGNGHDDLLQATPVGHCVSRYLLILLQRTLAPPRAMVNKGGRVGGVPNLRVWDYDRADTRVRARKSAGGSQG